MNQKRSILVLALSFAFVTSSVLSAANRIDTFTMRQKAMGGVGVATSFDETAIFQNPAGLAYAKKQFKMMRIGVEYTDSVSSKYEDFESLNDDKLTDVEKIGVLGDLPPFRGGIKQSIQPGLALTFPGIGVGVFSSGHVETSILRPSFPEITVEGYGDIVPALGLAREFDIFGPVALGITAKYISRYTLYDRSTGSNKIEYNTAEALTYFNDLDGKKEPGYYTSSGVGFDLGLIKKFDSKWFNRGSFGISIQNFGSQLRGTQEIETKENGITTITKQDVSQNLETEATVGFSFHEFSQLGKLPIVGFLFGEFEWGVDYRFISEDKNFGKNFYMGAEKKLLWDTLKLRGGIYQGYIGGGIGFDLKIKKFPILHLNYAQYAEENGEKAGQRPFLYQAFEVGIFF